MYRFRLPAIVTLLAVLLVGGSGAASAQQNDKPGQGSFLTVQNPIGESIALFCLDGQVDWSVRLLEGSEEPFFADSPGAIPCDSDLLVDALPGHKLLMYTSPVEGWTITPWNDRPEVRQCLPDDTLVTVATMGYEDEQPEVDWEADSPECVIPPYSAP